MSHTNITMTELCKPYVI